MPEVTGDAPPRFTRAAPAAGASEQQTLPVRYGWPVQLFALAAFTLAFVGWLNESWLFLFESPIWLNRYTEYAIILGFGVWRIRAEQNRYTRRRLVILVAVVTAFWWLLPWLLPMFEPYAGYLWAQPVFPSLHTPGTLTFFLVLGLVLLFGRRVICAFGCPCVGIRETVGFPFRRRTLRGPWMWAFRHVKWLFFVWYAGVLVATQYPPTGLTVGFVGGFWLAVGLTYFGTFFMAPLVGNRFYCRSLCPFGATFGLLNHAGFYDLKLDAERCIDCARCEQACDMGIPVLRQGKATGQVSALEDCMGCARCVVACPTDALEIRDVRNLLWPGLRRDASYLQRRDPPPALPPRAAPHGARLDPVALRVQAARCLDCGEPACRGACPLHNRIPEWLGLTARGEFVAAAELAHTTNPLPEFCGQLCPQERLCEGACARTTQGVGAVAIGAVEHAVVEEALAAGWRPYRPQVAPAGATAAVIGAGPAGLAFAVALNRAGWQVTVHDRDRRIGGMLASGLPPFRFDKRALDRRQALLEAAGIRFVLGHEVDQAGFGALLARHDALFLGLGARAARDLPLPGRDLDGVDDALDFLARVNRGDAGERVAGRRVLVLGGGDTAIDCARAALWAGAEAAAVVYRGPAERMRASPQERELAAAEGVEFHYGKTPRAFVGTTRVSGVHVAVAGGDAALQPCDQVVVAVGQQGSAPAWLAGFGIALDAGQVTVDSDGRTTRAGVYSGGDCVHGPDLIVTATAAGQRAAAAARADRPGRRKTLRRTSLPAVPAEVGA